MNIYHILKPTITTITLSMCIVTSSAYAADEVQSDAAIISAAWLEQIFNYTFGSNVSEVSAVPTRAALELENYIQLAPEKPSNQAADPVLQSIVDVLKTKESCFTGEDCIAQVDVTNALVGTDFVIDNTYNTVSIPPSLSVRSLLEPLTYQEQQEKTGPFWALGNTPSGEQEATKEAAYQFIKYLTSSVANFPQDEDFVDTVEDWDDIEESAKEEAAKYLADRYSYVALASIVIDNLYYLLEKRLPEENGISQQEEELRSVAKYDQAWRDELMNIPQKQVLEQIAILLAEQQKQNYLRGQENDRILSALIADSLPKLQEMKYQVIFDVSKIE